MNYLILLAFLIYFAVLFSIGLVFYRQKTSEAGFILGNRSLNYWVTAISTQSSDMGSWLFLGLPAVVFTTGLFEIWTPIGLVIFMFLTWQFIAPRLRVATAHYRTLTLWSFFEKKFNDTSGYLSLLCALITIYFFTCYIAVGLVGLSTLFESAFGLNYHIGILVAVAVTVGYTIVGGFLAVAWCNLFQGLFLLCMILLVPISAYNHVGGMTAIINAAHHQNVSLSIFPSLSSTFWALIKLAGWGLGYFGMPHLLVNFMGINDARNIRKAKVVGIIWQIIVLSSAVAMGLIALAYFPLGLNHPQQIFSMMVEELFSPLVAGFALCGVLAATLSTITTQIIVGASSIAEDIYKRFVNPAVTSSQLVLVTQLSTLSIGILSIITAWNTSLSIYDLTQYAWTGLGGSFGPLVLLSLYGKNITARGAMTGLCLGAFITIFWPLTHISQDVGLVTAFIINFVSTIIVSRTSQKSFA
ncbi:sodium/proline symporter [bacterium]|jgi:sodium/proline symporter|nr:sodium/proline symporter [bacterium]MBT5014862.1 sodium/proline symporter [bacterium]